MIVFTLGNGGDAGLVGIHRRPRAIYQGAMERRPDVGVRADRRAAGEVIPPNRRYSADL